MNIVKHVSLIRMMVVPLLVSIQFAVAEEHAAQPVFSVGADGATVSQGSKTLTLRRAFGQLRFMLDADVKCHAEVMQDFGEGPIGSVFFLNKTFATQDHEAIFTAAPRKSRSVETPLGEFSFHMKLLEDGWTQLTSAMALKDGAAAKSQNFFMLLPSFVPLSGSIESGGKRTTLNAASREMITASNLAGTVISLYPEHPGLSFKVALDEGMKAHVNKRLLSILPRDGRLSFRVNLGGEKELAPSDQFYNGVDFWTIDRLHLPDYKSRRNLLPNPSFEAGTRYYGFPIWGRDPWEVSPRQVLYEADDSQARFGSRSLRMNVNKRLANLPLGTFAIPLEKGAKYAVSFYAKGDRDDGLRVGVTGRGTLHYLWEGGGFKWFDVDTQWKRYSFDFIAELFFASCLYFEGRVAGASPATEGRIWLDGIQLERGAVTDYDEPPVAAQLSSAVRGNFLRFEQDPELRLNVKSLPDTGMAATLNVRDFFGKSLLKQTLDIRTDAGGDATVVLQDVDRLIREGQWRGHFPVSCEFASPAFDKPFVEYFRFSVMDFLDNTHRNKTIIQHGYRLAPQVVGPGMDRFLERERAVGVGACYWVGSEESPAAVDKHRSERVAAYGIEQLGRAVVVRRHGLHGKVVADDGREVMDNIKRRLNVTDAELDEFARICALKAQRRPWVKQWYFAAECNPGLEPLTSDLDSFGKFLLATLRGIKKGNPEAQVLITGGPWNMSAELGVKWVESYIQKTRELDPAAAFDGCGFHIYRKQPEDPDLDDEVRKALDMLDRNGVGHWPIYLDEGLNHFEYNLPILGASPYQGNSVKNFHGTLSYDLGRAERISVAFRVRSWLVAYKYQDRIKTMRDFAGEHRMYLDHDLTGCTVQKGINTLGRLLGNATFYRDIRFAPQCRCYVFIDEQDRPVAALWGHNELVDRWKQEAPDFTFDFSRDDVRIFDLMENERDYPRTDDGRTVVPAGPFPVFVRGQPGSKEQLCAAISGAQSVSGSDASVSINAYPTADGNASIVFRNLVSKALEGSWNIAVNGVDTPFAVSLDGLATRTEIVALGVPSADNGTLLPFDAECVRDGATTRISNPYMRLGLRSREVIRIDGDPGDWATIPGLQVGSNTIARIAIDNESLYLALEQTTTRPDAFAGVGVYIDPIVKLDTWSQARPTTDNIFVYEFQERADNEGLQAYRWAAPNVQEDSGYAPRGKELAKRVRVARGSRPDGASFVEAAFPRYALMPLELTAGARFGLNVSLPDENGARAVVLPVSDFKGFDQPCTARFVMGLIVEP